MNIGVTKGVTGVTQDFFLSEVPIYEGVTTDRASLEAGVTQNYYTKTGRKQDRIWPLPVYCLFTPRR